MPLLRVDPLKGTTGSRVTPDDMVRTYSGAQVIKFSAGNQTLVGVGVHAITLNALQEDVGGWHDVGTPNVFTVPEGVTRVSVYAGIKIAGNLGAADKIALEVTQNGLVVTPPFGVGSYRLAFGFFGTWTVTTPAIPVVTGDVFALQVNIIIMAAATMLIVQSFGTTLALEAVTC